MDHCFKTFVSVGNARQPFFRLLQAIEKNLKILPGPVLIQCGHTRFSTSNLKCTVKKFLSMDEFVECINQADIIILHAGAGSTMHALRAGKIPILMPRCAEYDEHINNHQKGFAKSLANSGNVVLVNDAEELTAAISDIDGRRFQTTKTRQDGLDNVLDRIEYKIKGIFGEIT